MFLNLGSSKKHHHQEASDNVAGVSRQNANMVPNDDLTESRAFKLMGFNKQKAAKLPQAIFIPKRKLSGYSGEQFTSATAHISGPSGPKRSAMTPEPSGRNPQTPTYRPIAPKNDASTGISFKYFISYIAPATDTFRYLLLFFSLNIINLVVLC